MHAAVRYFSRSGNTKLVADAIADAAHTQAVSADASDATLSEHVDVLFIGGALYAYGLDKHLRDYVRSLDASQVGKAVVFSSAWLSRHALDILRNELGARGIQVEERDFFVKNKANADQLEQARQFARSFL